QQVHRGAQEEPLSFYFFLPSNCPSAKPHALLRPAKHRFYRRASLLKHGSHRLVSQFFAVPEQRIMVRMNLYRSTGLAATALPSYGTGFITLATIQPNLVRPGFVPCLHRLKRQDFTAGTDALIW